MSTLAEVKLWGRTIGAVVLDESGIATFEYSPEFIESGIEVAPIMMPLSRKVYQFPSLKKGSFQGLPGLVSDALPDTFGNAIIDTWLAGQGRSPESFNAVERLCYMGKRGMGALEFAPTTGPRVRRPQPVEIDKLVVLASEVLREREQIHVQIAEEHPEKAMRQILQVGTSAGGARAKAIIAWNPTTNEVKSGQVNAPDGFGYWLLKFDGVSENKDKELADPEGYGVIEYTYSQMAKAAGITMATCRLYEEGGRRHFMTERFDRTGEGKKIHMQSLSALAHFDFDNAGMYSYEQTFQVIRELGLGLQSIEEMFRRMVFNCVARNQDDHVKNIAFLMNKQGEWSLAPAYDLTYSYNPHGAWTSKHQMSMGGKREGFTRDDLIKIGKIAGLTRGHPAKIIEQVVEAVSNWRIIAEKNGVFEWQVIEVEKHLRLFRKSV